MARYRTLGEYCYSTAGPDDDVRGLKIYGLGGEQIGTIVDVIFEQDSGCLLSVVVATTGPSGGRFMVPIEMIRSSFLHRNDCKVDVTLEQVERFPSYNDVETLSRMALEDDLAAWDDRDTKRLTKSRPASSVNDVQDIFPETGVSPEEVGTDDDTWVMGMGSRWLNLERQLRLLRSESTTVPIRKRARRGTEPPGGMRSKVG